MAHEVPTLDPADGRFVRTYWAEWDEIVNRKFNSRFRVNAPESVIGGYHDQDAVRGNGMLQIPIEEDPHDIAEAELYVELWGGHPGTANKRVSINGRSTYSLPSERTANEHCTHGYPTIALERSDLVRAENAIQFACDQGTTFWGQFIVDNAALRVSPPREHELVRDRAIGEFAPTVVTERVGEERLHLELDGAEQYRKQIETVHFRGRYLGYDANGNGEYDDWHGFTKAREPRAWLGSARQPPFEIEWDQTMLPSHDEVAVEAVVELADGRGQLSYETPVQEGLTIPERPDAQVQLHRAEALPRPFWSRIDRDRKTCAINVTQSATEIERAEIHVVIWDGGAGDVQAPLTLNEEPLPLHTDGGHDVKYQTFEISPAMLSAGRNTIEIRSDTEHHGLEVLYPGPALITRSTAETA